MIPELEPIPRRTRHDGLTEKPSPIRFCIAVPGEAPEIVALTPNLSAVLVRLAEAMPDGLGGGSPRLRKHIADLRASGVPINASREPRQDGGAGWVAVFRLACQVEAIHG